MTTVEPPPQAMRDPNLVFGGAVLVGALVAVLTGVYGQLHDPASETTIKLFFTTTLHFKRLSRVPWNFGGGPVLFRLLPRHHGMRV